MKDRRRAEAVGWKVAHVLKFLTSPVTLQSARTWKKQREKLGIGKGKKKKFGAEEIHQEMEEESAEAFLNTNTRPAVGR